MRTLLLAPCVLASALSAQDIPTAPPPVAHVAALDAVLVFFLRDDALWTCDGNGAQLRRWSPEGLSVPTPIALSPDGSRVALLRRRLTLLDAAGHTTDLGPFQGHAIDVAWSPDGGALAWSSSYRTVGMGAVWLVADVAAGAEPAPLSEAGAYDDHPAWSPDGRWLALAASRSHEVQQHADMIWVERKSRVELVDRATGKRTVACEREGEIDAIAWSPDGRWLAFEVDGELLVVPMAGGTPGPHRVLPAKPRRGGTLVWNPDSSWLLTDRNVVRGKVGSDARKSEDALLLVSLGGEVRELPLGDDAYGAAFTPDGAWILVGCGDRTLRRVEVATGAITTLCDGVDYWTPVLCRRRNP